MKVLVKKVGEESKLINIDGSLKSLQNLVGGYIETVSGKILGRHYSVVCNEEGRLRNLPYNCDFDGIGYVGDIFFVGVDKDEFCDIPDIIVNVIRDMLGEMGEDD
jgi:hypothetical protein